VNLPLAAGAMMSSIGFYTFAQLTETNVCTQQRQFISHDK